MEAQVDDRFILPTEDLKSPDMVKRTAALSKVLSLAAAGIDITSVFVGKISFHLSVNNLKATKILCYQSLRYCSFTDAQWKECLPLFVIDMMCDDEDLQIAALKTLPFLPTSVIKEGLQTELLGFNACFNNAFHPQRPSSRKVVIETLSSLLIYNPALMKLEPFWQLGWDLIIERLFDQKDFVVQAAFEALSRLTSELLGIGVEESDRLIPLAALLSHVEDYIVKTITNKWGLILARYSELDVSYRRAGVSVISFICKKIVEAKVMTKNEFGRIDLYPSPIYLVHEVVEQQFIPLLTCSDVSVIYEAGKAIIWLAEELGHQKSWGTQVAICWKDLLNWRGHNSATLTYIIETLLPILPSIPSRHLVGVTSAIIGTLQHIEDIEKRIQLLTEIFGAIYARSIIKMSKSESVTCMLHIENILQDSAVIDIWKGSDISVKQELLGSLIEALNSSHMQSVQNTPDFIHKKHKLGIYILSSCRSALSWSTSTVTFSLEAYIHLLDETFSYFSNHNLVRNQLIILLKSIVERIPRVKSDFVAGYLSFIAAKHSVLLKDEELGEFIFDNAKKRLFSNCLGYLTNAIADSSDAPFVVRDMDIALQAVVLLACGFSSLKKGIISLLNVIPKTGSYFQLVNKIQNYILQVNESSSETLAFHFIDPISCQTPPEFLHTNTLNQKYLAIFKTAAKLKPKKMAIGQIAAVNKRRPLTGSSEPVAIEACHILSHELCRITLSLKVINITGLPLKNVKVVVQSIGPVSYVHDVPQVTKTISLLGFEESIEWDVTYHLHAISKCSFVIQVYFQSETVGETSFEQELGLINVASSLEHARTTLSRASARQKLLSIVSTPYQLNLMQFLLPLPRSFNDFILQWLRFPASCKLRMSFPTAYPLDDFFEKLSAVFAKIVVNNDASKFRFCFSATSWFNDQILLNITEVKRTMLLNSGSRVGSTIKRGGSQLSVTEKPQTSTIQIGAYNVPATSAPPVAAAVKSSIARPPPSPKMNKTPSATTIHRTPSSSTINSITHSSTPQSFASASKTAPRPLPKTSSQPSPSTASTTAPSGPTATPPKTANVSPTPQASSAPIVVSSTPPSGIPKMHSVTLEFRAHSMVSIATLPNNFAKWVSKLTNHRVQVASSETSASEMSGVTLSRSASPPKPLQSTMAPW